MTKNERIAELEREVAELRLEVQRLTMRTMPAPMMPSPSPCQTIYPLPNWWRQFSATAVTPTCTPEGLAS